MQVINYTTHGTCSRHIHIELDGDRIEEVSFDGGCSGNTQGVAALVKGMTRQEAIAKLSGIRCGFKTTSCPDQLAKALQETLTNK